LWGLQRWIVNGRERTNVPSAYTRNIVTVGAILTHPVATPRVGKANYGGKNMSSVIGRIARHVAENGNMSEGIGTERNAVRHALWSAKITQEFGEKTALKITNAHQGVSVAGTSSVDFSKPFEGNLDLADNIVDVLNNDIGREIGKNSEGASVFDLASQVLEVFKNEGLWVGQENDDGSISIVRSKVSENQYDTAKSNLNKLDQNGMSQEDRDELEKDKK